MRKTITDTSATINKLTIILGWPEKTLWINRRAGHSYRKEYDAKNRALNEGCAATLQALNGEPKPNWQGKQIVMTAIAHKAAKGKYDLDNFHGSLKHFLDGIAATLGINDSQIAEVRIIKGDVVKGGSVEITLEVEEYER